MDRDEQLARLLAACSPDQRDEIARDWRIEHGQATPGDTLTIETYQQWLADDVAGVELEPAAIRDVTRKRAAGENLTKDDLVVMDAALRVTRPRNRPQRRDYPKRTLIELLFVRRLPELSCRARPRMTRPRRVCRATVRAHATRGAPGRPADDDDLAQRGAAA